MTEWSKSLIVLSRKLVFNIEILGNRFLLSYLAKPNAGFTAKNINFVANWQKAESIYSLSAYPIPTIQVLTNHWIHH